MLELEWGALLSAALVALVLPWPLRRSLARLSVFDVPNHRSSHTKVTLRGGGIAQVVALAVGGIFAVLAGADGRVIGLMLTTTVLMGLVGLAEDLRGLPISVRAGSQLVIGMTLTSLAIHLDSSALWVVPLGGIAFACYVNFTNFMDGINGISAMHGLAVGIVYAWLGSLTAKPWLALLGALVAIVFIAFLPWNIIPPGLFLGDVGSYALGAAVSTIAILGVIDGIPMMALVAPLAIYLGDTIFTLTKRMVRKEALTIPHRNHTYERLVDAGYPHLAVALSVAALSVLCGGIGLAAFGNPTFPVWGAWLLIGGVVLVYLSSPKLLGKDGIGEVIEG